MPHAVAYTCRGLHTPWPAHAVAYTCRGLHTPWPTHAVAYTRRGLHGLYTPRPIRTAAYTHCGQHTVHANAWIHRRTIGSFYNAIVVQPQTLQSHCLSPFCCMTSNLYTHCGLHTLDYSGYLVGCPKIATRIRACAPSWWGF